MPFDLFHFERPPIEPVSERPQPEGHIPITRERLPREPIINPETKEYFKANAPKLIAATGVAVLPVGLGLGLHSYLSEQGKVVEQTAGGSRATGGAALPNPPAGGYDPNARQPGQGSPLFQPLDFSAFTNALPLLAGVAVLGFLALQVVNK